MIRTALRWLATSVALLFTVTVLTFLLTALAPGDAAKAMLAGNTSYTPEQYQQLRHQLGLDQPLPVQYWHWLRGLLHGDLGADLFSGQPITQILGNRLGPSLALIVAAVAISTIVGVGLGVYSAARGGPVARALDGLSLLGLALPNFWLALVLIDLLAVRARVFPATGYTTFAQSPAEWVRGLTLPVLAVSIGGSAVVARQTREAMADVLAAEFVTALRARGLPLRSVLLRHALRNAAIPVVTVVGLIFISLLGGAVIVESVFSIPGLGQLAVGASSSHNLPVIEGVAFAFTVIVIAVNLLVEAAYRVLNPAVDRP